MLTPLIIVLVFFMPPSVCPLSQQQPQHDKNNKITSFGKLLQSNTENHPLFGGGGGDDTSTLGGSSSSSSSSKWRYWCDTCACGFNKLKSYQQHVSGKRHIAVLDESESLWLDYMKSGPAYYDPSVDRIDVTRAWSLDVFMDGLQARSRSSTKHVLLPTTSAGAGGLSSNNRGHQLDPSIRLCNLPPQKRAALWRYLHTTMFLGDGSVGLASMVAALPPHHVRIKELLESIETFQHVHRIIQQRKGSRKKITHIYDVGCGHGLVGMLCAVSYPQIQVHAIDLVPRDSFQAHRKAFISTGTPIDNLTFEAGDLSMLQGDRNNGSSADDKDQNTSLILCIHGCKSLTHESIELAERNKWAWLVLPCCLQAENHLDDKTSLKNVPDATRFAMLCGAIAARHQPDIVTTIDSRITARGILLASSEPDYKQ